METIYTFLLDLTGWPLAFILLAGGIYFTVRTGFIQLRMLKESVKVVLEKPRTPGTVSSFGALMISTASRVGTGNIIGVSVAICAGGPGAAFWMWLTALIGGASAFIESTLAQICKRRDANGGSYGGPSFYIESVCRSKVLAVIFAIALIFTYGVGYNMLASFNLQSSFEAFDFYRSGISCWIIGGLTAAAFLFAISGGAGRLVRITGSLVPVMGIVYILLAVTALAINFEKLPGMFAEIFRSAFDFRAICGGFAGSVVMLGLKRGLYSNEAGIGSAPNAAASADVSHPVKQGLVQMLSVFIDTNLLCTATALMCLSSGITPEASIQGAPYVQAALGATFGSCGPYFIAAAMMLFAFTTLLGNFYYVENCFAYIFGRRPGKKSLILIRLGGTILIFAGAGLELELAWGIADISQCILAFINIPVCIFIGGAAYKALNDYREQRKRGLDPEFNAQAAGIDIPTDFWQDSTILKKE